MGSAQWGKTPVEHATREEEAAWNPHHGVGGEGRQSLPKEENSHIYNRNGRNVCDRVEKPREKVKRGGRFDFLAFQRKIVATWRVFRGLGVRNPQPQLTSSGIVLRESVSTCYSEIVKTDCTFIKSLGSSSYWIYIWMVFVSKVSISKWWVNNLYFCQPNSLTTYQNDISKTITAQVFMIHSNR